MVSLLRFASLLGGVLFVLTSIVVGARLLLLARRTKELPELLIGLAFAVAGSAGYFLGLVDDLVELPESVNAVRPYVARALVAGGSVLTAVATWKIFHAGSARGGALVVSLGALLLFDVFPISLSTPDASFLLRRATDLLLLLPYAWMSVASLRYRANLTKQWRIGLGASDPMLARRLRLWGWGTGSIAGLFLTLQVISFVNYFADSRFPSGLFVAAWGIACSVCMWLAFFGQSSASSGLSEA